MDTNQKLLERIVAFCEDCEKVSALVLIGSQARNERKADAFSDLDFLLVVKDVPYFLNTDEWLNQIGKHHISFIENTIDGQKERRIVFDHALDADFVIIPFDFALQLEQNTGSMEVLRYGYRILVNKNNLSLPDPSQLQFAAYRVPAVEEFDNNVQDFWFHAIWTTKKLLRGELWTAKFCVDHYMKWKLLWIIEHYEHMLHGPTFHTWYGGRFIHDWAEEHVKTALAQSFAAYNKREMAAALINTMDLYRTLAVDVSKGYGFPYPAHADEYSTQWVKNAISTDLS